MGAVRDASQVERQHVLQLIETGGPGGAERVLISLTESLNRQPRLRASAGLLKEGWLADELRRHGLSTFVEPLHRAVDPGYVRRLVRLLRRQQVALVHAHEFTMNVYATLAARLAQRPVVATVHGKGYYTNAGRRRWAMRALPALGARVVAVSADIQRFLAGELGVRPVGVIPNGIDVERYTRGERERARAVLGLPAGVRVVGAVGNLYRVKGHAILLAAVARLDDRAVQVVIAGRGEEESALREQARSLGLGERLHLLGFRDDVPALLPAFDVYALPSFSEGQSLALIEAMAAGLPIVASQVGGNPEIIEEGRSGLLFEAGNADALKVGLERLLANRELAGNLGAAARGRAVREFSTATMVERYRHLYAELGVGEDR